LFHCRKSVFFSIKIILCHPLNYESQTQMIVHSIFRTICPTVRRTQKRFSRARDAAKPDGKWAGWGFSGSGSSSRSPIPDPRLWAPGTPQMLSHPPTHGRARTQRPLALTHWQSPPQRHAPADNTHVNINVKHTKAVREVGKGGSPWRSIGNRAGVQPWNY